MGAITYEAKRSLIPGHVENDLYDLETDFQAINPRKKSTSFSKTPLDGVSIQTVFHNIVDGWNLRSGHITPDANDDLPADWVEFMDSVLDGSTFTLDVLGSIAAPRNPQTVKLRQNSQFGIGRVGTLNRFIINFDVVVVS
jgi:hypothetical protein